jgi:UDP-N-acetylmuramoyl-L-alanyl-D-glutamate--2,6-diaminopimelate ligase
MNSLAALTAAAVLGVDEAVAAQSLAGAPAVRGRFEVIDQPGAPTVVIDFAHTPDGLEQVLAAARPLVGSGRLIVVFGCGGDRDAPKRQVMGAVAARGADVVVLTSDNPRSEDPLDIVRAIREGVEAVDASRLAMVDVDRRAAIEAAVTMATPDDVIVVAGKGHETTQTIGEWVLPFDDAAEARRALASCR